MRCLRNTANITPGSECRVRAIATQYLVLEAKRHAQLAQRPRTTRRMGGVTRRLASRGTGMSSVRTPRKDLRVNGSVVARRPVSPASKADDAFGGLDQCSSPQGLCFCGIAYTMACICMSLAESLGIRSGVVVWLRTTPRCDRAVRNMEVRSRDYNMDTRSFSGDRRCSDCPPSIECEWLREAASDITESKLLIFPNFQNSHQNEKNITMTVYKPQYILVL